MLHRFNTVLISIKPCTSCTLKNKGARQGCKTKNCVNSIKN